MTAWSGIGGRGNAEPIVLGRRFCTDCGRWRHLVDFGARRRDENGDAVSWFSFCKTCRRLEVGAKPVFRRSRQGRLALRRARRRELRKDPIWLAREREYQRIYKEIQRRAAGIPPRNWRNRATVIDQVERVYLPAAPLLRLIDLHERSETELAEFTGVAERWIYHARYESHTFRIDHADALAVALGFALSLIYPYDDEAAA